MTSLLHHHFRGTDSEALSYLEDIGWTSRMATPSPGVHALGGAVFLALGAVAGAAIAPRNLPAGIAAAVAGATLALLDVLPAIWTLTHREYTTQYLAARSFFGGGRHRLHPQLVLVGLPAMSFLAAAFAPAHASTAARLLFGLLGAAIGVSLGLLRVVRARRSPRVAG